MFVLYPGIAHAVRIRDCSALPVPRRQHQGLVFQIVLAVDATLFGQSLPHGALAHAVVSFVFAGHGVDSVVRRGRDAQYPERRLQSLACGVTAP